MNTWIKPDTTDSIDSLICPYCGYKDPDIGDIINGEGNICYQCKGQYYIYLRYSTGECIPPPKKGEE